MSMPMNDGTNWKVAGGGIALGLVLAFLPLLFPMFLFVLGMAARFRGQPQSALILLPSLGLLMVAMILVTVLEKMVSLKGIADRGELCSPSSGSRILHGRVRAACDAVHTIGAGGGVDEDRGGGGD